MCRRLSVAGSIIGGIPETQVRLSTIIKLSESFRLWYVIRSFFHRIYPPQPNVLQFYLQE
jgi:hypothetical protein